MQNIEINGNLDISHEFDIQDMVSKFEECFRDFYFDKIQKIAERYPQERSLVVDFEHIERTSLELAKILLDDPDRALECAQRALKNIDIPLTDAELTLRIRNLPEEVRMNDIRSELVGKLVQFRGVVRRISEVRPKVIEAVFRCSRCKNEVIKVQKGTFLDVPNYCEYCKKGSYFKFLEKKSKYVDSQRISVQESPEYLRGGEMPKLLDVYLTRDLCGIVSPGDKVKVIGIVRSVINRTKGKKLSVFNIMIEGNYIEHEEPEIDVFDITKEDEKIILELSKDEHIFEKLKNSIAPHIHGYEPIKEAIVLQLMSAPPTELPNGQKIRGDIHILLIGDPSTGKSDILTSVADEVAPKGLYTSGKGASQAGLTVAVVRNEQGEWTLEAGAMVLADRGIACLDELDKMKAEDRSAIHEALEQQHVSVAKAGIIATLNARCSVLAAANPKDSRFDETEDLSSQFNLPPTILSRFDLIFCMRDDLSKTKEITKHILDTASAPVVAAPVIDPTILKKYIVYAKKNVHPKLTRKARDKIEEFFTKVREEAEKNPSFPIPMTVRQLWAIIRLSMASARVRLSDEVQEEDVERAIKLIKESLNEVGIDVERKVWDIDRIVGIPKSTRDKMKCIRKIIEELEIEGEDKRVKVDDIIKIAGKEHKIQKDEVLEILKKMLEGGEIYNPSEAYVRRVQ